MIHITIDGPSRNIELDVQPTDVVEGMLGMFSEDLDDPEESRYYERAIIIGEGIPLHTGKTFAECGIEHGDTLYHVLGLKKYCSIQKEFGIENIIIPSPNPRCSTVRDVSEARSSEAEKHTDKMSTTAPDPRLGDEILDKSKTLAERKSRKNKEVVYQFKKPVGVSIGVPMYTKMEQVSFKPQDTIADVKKEVERMMPGFEYTEGIRKAYPVPLRGMFNICENGTTACMYLDIFRKKMEMFVVEYKEEEPVARTGCYIGSTSTLADVHSLIKTRGKQNARLIHQKKWPMELTYDCAWMRTFAPQIEAKPLLTGTPMALFFFPLRVESVQSNKVSPYISVAGLADFFCKEHLRSEGVKRSICLRQTGKPLPSRKWLEDCHDSFVSDGTSSSVFLKKRDKERDPIDLLDLDKYITVSVHWQNSISKFDVKSTRTVNTLRDEIENDIKVPFYMQKLVFNGSPVQCNDTFEEVGIIHDSTLDLLAVVDFEISQVLLR